MSFQTLAISALLVLHFITSIASPVGPRADDELIKVPGGFVPKSNFHIVPEGGKIVHTPDLVQLFDANGNVLHSAPLTGSKSLFSHLNNSGTSPLGARQNENTGTVLASFEAPSVFAFSGNWIVPPLPQKNSGQLLQYFIGLGPPSLDSLVFPVLQYGAAANGGGAFWSLSSWLITGDQAFATNITAATVAESGDTVTAFIDNQDSILSPPSGTDIWLAGFSIVTGTLLEIQSTVVFNEVIVALETTNAFLEDNLPNQTTNLEDVALEESDSSTSFPSSLPWEVSGPIDLLSIKVVSAAGIEGSLQIDYVGELF